MRRTHSHDHEPSNIPWKIIAVAHKRHNERAPLVFKCTQRIVWIGYGVRSPAATPTTTPTTPTTIIFGVCTKQMDHRVQCALPNGVEGTFVTVAKNECAWRMICVLNLSDDCARAWERASERVHTFCQFISNFIVGSVVPGYLFSALYLFFLNSIRRRSPTLLFCFYFSFDIVRPWVNHRHRQHQIDESGMYKYLLLLL